MSCCFFSARRDIWATTVRAVATDCGGPPDARGVRGHQLEGGAGGAVGTARALWRVSIELPLEEALDLFLYISYCPKSR